MLIACPECRAQVSEAAVACPRCGAPLGDEYRQSAKKAKQQESERVRNGCIGCGCLTALVVFLVVVLGGRSDNGENMRRASTATAPAAATQSQSPVGARQRAASPAPQPAAPAASRLTPTTVEHMLATIEAGRPVEPTDYRVALFASHLDSLERKTTNTRSDVGDIIVKASELAARDGRPISILGVAQALDASIPPEGAEANLKLEEVAAVWLALYLQGK